MVFLLTHLCEIEPVFQLNIARGVKEGALVFFSREEQQRSCTWIYISICCLASHNIIVENQTAISFYMNPRTTEERTSRKCLWLALAVANLVEQVSIDLILRSVILCGTFRRISQLWENARTLNLDNCLLYLSFTISQFFDFIQRTRF